LFVCCSKSNDVARKNVENVKESEQPGKKSRGENKGDKINSNGSSDVDGSDSSTDSSGSGTLSSGVDPITEASKEDVPFILKIGDAIKLKSAIKQSSVFVATLEIIRNGNVEKEIVGSFSRQYDRIKVGEIVDSGNNKCLLELRRANSFYQNFEAEVFANEYLINDVFFSMENNTLKITIDTEGYLVFSVSHT
jgi:hypothetical protein